MNILFFRCMLLCLVAGISVNGLAQASGEPARIGKIQSADFHARVDRSLVAMQQMSITKVALQTPELKGVNELVQLLHPQMAMGVALAAKTGDAALKALAIKQTRFYEALLARLQDMGTEKNFVLPPVQSGKLATLSNRLQKMDTPGQEREFVIAFVLEGNLKILEEVNILKGNSRESNLKQLMNAAGPGIKTLIQAGMGIKAQQEAGK